MLNQPRDFLDSLASNEDVKNRINTRVDQLYNPDSDGILRPFVCCVCDEFIVRKKDIKVVSVGKMKKARKLLSWAEHLRSNERIPGVEVYYRFPEHIPGEADQTWLEGMALSPRGSLHTLHERIPKGFVTCSDCKKCVEKNKMPVFAIVNNNFVGAPPDELLELNEVERAFLTPIKSYGYCFNYQGGQMKLMNGSLTFMRVEERSIAKAVGTLECMGLTKNVVVISNGPMTAKQQKKVSEMTTCRTDKMIAAAKWLSKNHKMWSGVDFKKIEERIGKTQPIRVDKASTVDSKNATVEDEVVFTCYYPDGSTNNQTGGFQSPEDFKTFVEETKRQSFDAHLKSHMTTEFVQCKDGDHLIGACLLQFPYGICSIEDERRQLPSKMKRMDLSSFLDHISKKADPLFQTSMFQLICYSLKSKARLLRYSTLQLKQKIDVDSFAEGFSAADFCYAAKARREKKRKGSKHSNVLLDAVDATSRELPHTDGAAKKALSSMESMFHHLGMGSVFLTVTFDDENSLLIQILSGIEVDKGEKISDLTDEELSRRAKKRASIRYEFPGIAALNFEVLLDILLEEVICWDTDKNEPLPGKKGLFGNVKAVAYAVEEQGRKTLHVHFILWIEEYDLLQQDIFFGDHFRQPEAKAVAAEYSDHLATTSFFGNIPSSGLKKAFDHQGCQVAKQNRQLPEVVDDQTLRVLRHKKGYEQNGGIVAKCPHCDKKWTYEGLVRDALINLHGVKDSTTGSVPTINDKQLRKDRLFAEIVSFQHPSKKNDEVPTACINAAYQCHASCHHKNCFRCNKLQGSKKRKHRCDSKCECRYNLPDKSRRKTMIHTDHVGFPWYTWAGGLIEQPLVSFLPKRSKYDLFQNSSCKAISESKFSCNSNVRVITDGPIGMYTCKYISKPNEQDDTVEYAHIEATLKRMEAEGRKHEQNKREALRIVCRAAFAHNRKNVVSASMASYLTRHNSRFYFSHSFGFCPLSDVIRLHNKQDVTGSVHLDSNGSSFFENQALHYLCRHAALENTSLKEFTEKFESAYVTKKNLSSSNPVKPFQSDTGFYKHPSRHKDTNGSRASNKRLAECRQGMKLREEDTHIKVPQWLFPDTEQFKGNILTCGDDDINRPMEKYAQLVLALFLPHRNAEDLKCQKATSNKYTHKFREVFTADQLRVANGERQLVFTLENLKFLQNVQNAAYNSLRYQGSFDDLKSSTDAFNPKEGVDLDADSDEEGEDGEEHEDDTEGYEQFLECLSQQYDRPLHDEDPSLLLPALNNFSFTSIRKTGENGCGFKEDIQLPDLIDRGTEEPFLKTISQEEYIASLKKKRKKRLKKREREAYSVKEITAVLLQRRRKQHRCVWKDKNIDVGQATGTVSSIREWAKAGFATDKKQQRAFEAIVASFVLTFFEDSKEDFKNNATGSSSSEEKRRYRRARNALLKLKGHRKDTQLIALLHGPGGSGKSTVINMVTAYAKSYCESLDHPFTSRTITLTALSGVAATLLHGETTHMALGLNKKRLPNSHIAEFNDARLIIVDEISFASTATIEKIQECCKVLLGSSYRAYGGVNIVFAGDYSQLDPVKAKQKVWEVNDLPKFHTALNCFIELNGCHRFMDDPIWGERLLRFRNGNPTLEDIKILNAECHVRNKVPPKNIQVATYYNKNRDAINAAIFEDWCDENFPEDGGVLESACMVFMDNLEMADSIGSFVQVKSNQVKEHFYKTCGENACKMPKSAKGRVDPILKLYPDCPMMLVHNKDVPNGQANGSRVRVKGIKAKPGEASEVLKLDSGTKVRVMFASQVQSILVEHENDDIEPRQFEVTMENFTFKTDLTFGDLEMRVKMKGSQFPLISNSCTTGHKLQGCTVDRILVNDWRYSQNWAYVVLSRVRTMDGLYIRQKLTTNLEKYKKNKKVLDMLDTFRKEIKLKNISDAEYEQMIQDEALEATEEHDTVMEDV